VNHALVSCLIAAETHLHVRACGASVVVFYQPSDHLC